MLTLFILHDCQVYECKEQLQAKSDELDMMLSCYKETQLSANQKLATTRRDKPVLVVRANEICFKHAQWQLTDPDGQLGIADLVLSNFLYVLKCMFFMTSFRRLIVKIKPNILMLVVTSQ